MKNNTFSPKRKNRVKIVRGILQGIILIILLVVIIKALFSFSVYEPYDSSKEIVAKILGLLQYLILGWIVQVLIL